MTEKRKRGPKVFSRTEAVMIRVTPETLKAVDVLAEQQCRSRSSQISFILQDWLNTEQLGQ